MPTNKDLLTEIQSKSDKTAKDLFQLSCDFSDYINKQDNFNENQKKVNQRILSILESDPSINYQGIPEKVNSNTKRLDNIDKDRSKVVFGFFVVCALGSLVSWFVSVVF